MLQAMRQARAARTVKASRVKLAPRRPLLKEWAYAGAFFTYT
jgi:hypothetical protein